MIIKITKQQLRDLNAKAGKVNADSGKLFLGVRGALNQNDNLYHVAVEERDLQQGESLPESFSLNAVLEPAAPPSLPEPTSEPAAPEQSDAPPAQSLADASNTELAS